MANFFSEPVKNFRFIVEVESDGGKTVAAFAQFSGIQMRLETVPIRSGSEPRGVMDDIPALTGFAPITLSKGVIGDNEFLSWLQASAPGAVEAATGVNKSRTVNIIALDDRGNPAVTWSLFDVMPVAYILGDMDSSRSAVLTESMEFSIGAFKRETHMPPPE